jgi:hypothetical protein
VPVAPGSQSPGSSSFAGPGNPKPPKRCPKDKVRKKGRCVAKHKPKKHNQGKHRTGKKGRHRG